MNDKILNKWNDVKKELPPENKYVLVHLTKKNWIDLNDKSGVYFKVAKLKKGISSEERNKMKSGEIEDYNTDIIKENGTYIKRSSVYEGGDEYGNNLKSYRWEEFGPGDYFGQEVDYWMYIPNLD